MTGYDYVRDFATAARICKEHMAKMPRSVDKVIALRKCIEHEMIEMHREERDALKRRIDEITGHRSGV